MFSHVPQPLYNNLCGCGGNYTTILIGLLNIHNIEVLETHYDLPDILQFTESLGHAALLLQNHISQWDKASSANLTDNETYLKPPEETQTR